MNLKEYIKTLPDLRKEKLEEIAQESCSNERTVERWIYGYNVPIKLKREAVSRVVGMPESALWKLSDDRLVPTGRLKEWYQAIPLPGQMLRAQLSEATGVDERRVRMWIYGMSVPTEIVRRKVCEITGQPETDIWPSLLEREGGES